MTLELLTLILVVSLAVMLMAGQWTAFALGICGVLVLYLSKGMLGLTALSSVVWNNANSYILIAVPMFLLMGEIILRSGVSSYFYRGVVVLLGRLPGGLLHANIASCAVFSAVSGSSVATAATVGTVAIPEMLSRGYEPKTVFGSLAAGGTLGILIPPSIVMVLYGALVEESIARLFMAGVLPGLLMAGIFMVFIAVLLLLKPSYAPPREAGKARRIGEAVHVFPVLGLLVVVLGSIYSGIATPTEASALGAAGAIVLALGYRSFTRKVFTESLMATVKTTCMVALIIICAQILSTALTYSGVSRTVSEWVMGLGLGKWQFFVALVVLYLLLGCFVDGVSMIYMTLPVLLPVVKAFGFDLVWFGVILTVLIELGQITPPVGLNLFTIHAISGGAKFSAVAAGSAPYVALMLLVILMLCLWPEIALWLPTTMRG
ncbi:MAG: TRAP transporter large permease subunit [Rhodospirillales bacterium]|nr:TRAP transporter large permease subunit [Rhodospirillales bacterium]